MLIAKDGTIIKNLLYIIGILFMCSCNTVTNNAPDDQKDPPKVIEKVDNRKLAYENEGFIYYFDFSTGKTKKLLKGSDPCISPDGKWIAFTEVSNPGKNSTRVVKLINTENSAIKELGIDNKNHYGGIWSPTGEYLLFNLFSDHWDIALIKPNSSEIRMLPTANSVKGLYASTWSPDGKHIYAHDLYNIYKYSINGDIVDKYSIEELLGEEQSHSSATCFWFTSDNKVIFEGDIPEEIEGLDGPSSAIFSYDLTTKKVKRISKKGICAVNLWIDKQERVYFSGFDNNNNPRKIYQTRLTDPTLTELVNGGMTPSIGQ